MLKTLFQKSSKYTPESRTHSNKHITPIYTTLTWKRNKKIANTHYREREREENIILKCYTNVSSAVM